MLARLYRYLLTVGFRAHYNVWKSWPHRLFEGRRKMPVKMCVTWPDVVHDCEMTSWQADGWRELWDRVPTPEHAEWLFAQGEKITHGRDCGAFAMLIAARVAKSLRAKERRPMLYNGLEIIECEFLTIVYEGGAHNVALLWLYDKQEFTISFAAADYTRHLRVFNTEREVIDDIIFRASPDRNAKLVAASVQTCGLRHVRLY